MNYNQNIEFVSLLLNKLHIASHVIEEPEQYMSSEINGGLRATLFGESDYSKLLVNSPTEAKEKIIYRFFDEYLCNFIFFKIPNMKSSYFYIGPYLLKFPTEEFIIKKSNQLFLNEIQTEQLRAYYRKLPMIEDETILLNIMDTLGTFLWNGANNYNMEYVTYEIPDKRNPIYSSDIFDGTEGINFNFTLEMIEHTYQNEKKLMESISKGKLNKVNMIVSTVLKQREEEYLLDSLRNRKNELIVLNTLLRKSAEYGEVHPYHVHRLSLVYEQKIEELYSMEQSLELQKEMIRKYCVLVKEYSLKKYSHLIGRVITLISYDLSANLTLKHIASIMNVNASYLSATFKKECGETLTNYVNRKRVENAAYILAHSNKQIQIIAEECGILDVNYFIKLFKKQYGVTPTQYKASIL